ncbi:MAG: molybdopterin-dependent oxidoreductase, partial [Desulfatiglandales bacterium]
FGDLLGLPEVKISTPFHCVTGWSNLGLRWGGILFKEFLKRTEPKKEAKFAFFRCYDGYTTNLPLEVLMDEDVILAYELEEKPLPPEHGFPLRLVVPKRYAYKSPKWLGEIEFSEIDRKGYWEMRGYSNSADPYKEERYS